MSEPQEPAPDVTPETTAAHQQPAAEPPTVQAAAAPPPPYPYPPPPRRFGPAFGRFVRHRATGLVAAVIIGALIGGGTVAIVDNATHSHSGPGMHRVFRPGGPYYYRVPFNGGQGGPGFGN